MLTHTSRWSHARGNEVVPSRWQATASHAHHLVQDPALVLFRSLHMRLGVPVVCA